LQKHTTHPHLHKETLFQIKMRILSEAAAFRTVPLALVVLKLLNPIEKIECT